MDRFAVRVDATPSVQATISAPSFYTNIDVPAAHYPCDFGAITQCTDFTSEKALPRLPGWSPAGK
jgi:hypothetical protein